MHIKEEIMEEAQCLYTDDFRKIKATSLQFKDLVKETVHHHNRPEENKIHLSQKYYFFKINITD